MNDDDQVQLLETRAELRAVRTRQQTHSFRIGQLESRGGEPGPEGPKGDVGPMPKHRWNGTALQFQQGPEGDEWGKSVDLKGDKGEPGLVNVIGGGGGNTTTVVTAPATPTFSWFPLGF